MTSYIYSFNVAISEEDMTKLRSGDKGVMEPIVQIIAATMGIDDMGVKTNQKAREFVLFSGEMPDPIFINLVGDA